MSMMRRIFITGKVHNVGYRAWAIRRANELRLAGWVRNLKDGRVEILAAGEEDAVSALIEDCRTGSEFSRVDTVIAEAATDRMPKGFTKRFTV
ncbi:MULTISPECIES: acylphosphatase [unclassified Sphingomonas]|uniref:acylphosphatase n=2 Tax=Sphingomonas TaxID=13687 RepID=UPI00269AAE9E